MPPPNVKYSWTWPKLSNWLRQKAEKAIKEAQDELKNSQKDARRRINDANKHATRKEKKINEKCHIQTQKSLANPRPKLSKVKEEMKLVKEKSSRDIINKINEKKRVKCEGRIKDQNQEFQNFYVLNATSRTQGPNWVTGKIYTEFGPTSILHLSWRISGAVSQSVSWRQRLLYERQRKQSGRNDTHPRMGGKPPRGVEW